MATARSLIFYSWQSDLPNRTNRGFIQKALENAARSIRQDESVDVEPVVDRDTAGLPGAPDIARAILRKIEQSQVFVCDVSIINGASAMRATPNPNVLIELGYALKALGEDRILMVLNEAFGGPELLPFDLRMRRAIPYRLSEKAEDRVDVRKELEQRLAEGLRAIFAGLQMAATETVVEPVPLLEQTLAAVDAVRPNRATLIRGYMDELATEVSRLTPQFSGVQQDEWDDLLVAAIEQSQDLSTGFARLTSAIASMKDSEAATALYSAFGKILDLYVAPPGTGSYYGTDFDFAKFIGHELFVTFFSALAREACWNLIADLLEEDIYVRRTMSGNAEYVSFDYVSQHVALLDHRNRRLQANRISMHANLLSQRHTEGELARLVPMNDFMEADYLLFLRALFQSDQPGVSLRWLAWSTLYMQEVPRFIEAASRVKYAERLLRPLGVEDVESLRTQIAAHKGDLRRLFSDVLWRGGMYWFDPAKIGSRA